MLYQRINLTQRTFGFQEPGHKWSLRGLAQAGCSAVVDERNILVLNSRFTALMPDMRSDFGRGC
jgi:hypothetical protein